MTALLSRTRTRKKFAARPHRLDAAEALESLDQALAFARDCSGPPSRFLETRLTECILDTLDHRRRQRVGCLDPVQHPDDIAGGHDGPAARAGEGERFRQCSQYDQVVESRQQFDRGGRVRKLDIGLVDDDRGTVSAALQDLDQGLSGDQVPGRIVRRTQEYQPRRSVARVEQCVGVEGEAVLFRRHRGTVFGSLHEGVVPVHRESRRRRHNVILAGAAECPHQQIDGLARAAGDEQSLGRATEIGRQRRAEAGRTDFRIAIQRAAEAVGFARPRCLVGIQADRIVDLIRRLVRLQRADFRSREPGDAHCRTCRRLDTAAA